MPYGTFIFLHFFISSDLVRSALRLVSYSTLCFPATRRLLCSSPGGRLSCQKAASSSSFCPLTSSLIFPPPTSDLRTLPSQTLNIASSSSLFELPLVYFDLRLFFTRHNLLQQLPKHHGSYPEVGRKRARERPHCRSRGHQLHQGAMERDHGYSPGSRLHLHRECASVCFREVIMAKWLVFPVIHGSNARSVSVPIHSPLFSLPI